MISDFSYLARATFDFGILIWSTAHIYSIDKFESLRWRTIKRGEVKSIMTILFLLSLSSLLVRDIIETKIMYSEGFFMDPSTHEIIVKPPEFWSSENKKLSSIASYIYMFFCAMENSAIFLLQNFWNYLSNTIVKERFITTWQFRINYFFIVITLATFSCMPFIFDDEIFPDLLTASCNFIVIIYGLMAHFKFSALIKKNKENHVADRLKYYKDMNFLFILIIATCIGLMVTLCVDALSEDKYLTSNKFTSDLFFGLINLLTAGFWVVWLLIFYPRTAPTYSDRQSDKSIEIKIDSTTIANTGYTNDKDNNSLRYSIQKNDYVQLPSPLVANDKQVILYTDSPRRHQYFT